LSRFCIFYNIISFYYTNCIFIIICYLIFIVYVIIYIAIIFIRLGLLLYSICLLNRNNSYNCIHNRQVIRTLESFDSSCCRYQNYRRNLYVLSHSILELGDCRHRKADLDCSFVWWETGDPLDICCHRWGMVDRCCSRTNRIFCRLLELLLHWHIHYIIL
jgi:hypothetical protein